MGSDEKFIHQRKINLQGISLQDKGPQVRWDQTAAQCSIILFHIILVSMISDEISVWSKNYDDPVHPYRVIVMQIKLIKILISALFRIFEVQ